MGAGRSGTTLLATLLGNAKGITTLGEMHQFLDYYLDKKPCSCGADLDQCEFWSKVIKRLEQNYSRQELIKMNQLRNCVEGHRHIIWSLLRSNKAYQTFQRQLFEHVAAVHPNVTLLDSAKYISRGLQLARIKETDVKVVYVVRDVRGVIFSFGKKVQTQKSPLSAMIYYKLINFFGLLAQWTMGKGKVMRLRYESLVESPEESLSHLETFLDQDLSAVNSKLKAKEPFQMPHIIAGNRLVSAKHIELKPDFAWKQTQPRAMQMLYYLLNLPLQLIFKYRI